MKFIWVLGLFLTGGLICSPSAQGAFRLFYDTNQHSVVMDESFNNKGDGTISVVENFDRKVRWDAKPKDLLPKVTATLSGIDRDDWVLFYDHQYKKWFAKKPWSIFGNNLAIDHNKGGPPNEILYFVYQVSFGTYYDSETRRLAKKQGEYLQALDPATAKINDIAVGDLVCRLTSQRDEIVYDYNREPDRARIEALFENGFGVVNGTFTGNGPWFDLPTRAANLNNYQLCSKVKSSSEGKHNVGDH